MTLCSKFKVDLSHGVIEIRELGEFRFAGKSSENHFFGTSVCITCRTLGRAMFSVEESTSPPATGSLRVMNSTHADLSDERHRLSQLLCSSLSDDLAVQDVGVAQVGAKSSPASGMIGLLRRDQPRNRRARALDPCDSCSGC